MLICSSNMEAGMHRAREKQKTHGKRVKFDLGLLKQLFNQNPSDIGLGIDFEALWVRVLFKGGSYSFLDTKTAGLIQGRASFKGGSLSRIYGNSKTSLPDPSSCLD